MPKKTPTISPSSEEEKPIKPVLIKVIGKLSNISPDLRQYKPSTPQIFFDPMLQVAIDVPATPDLITNGDKIMSAQLTNQDEPEPIFTPLGMRYIIDQFEAVMSNPKSDEPEEESKSSAGDDWDDGETEEKSEVGSSESKSSEDKSEWDEESEDSDKDEKANFDDDNEWND